MPSVPPRANARYTSSQRIEVLRLALQARRLTYAEIEELLEVSHATAWRLVKVLRTTDDLEETTDDEQRPVFRIRTNPKIERLRIAPLELVSLFAASRILSIFSGTGIHEDHDSVLERLSATLRPADAQLLRGLERKVHFVPFGGRRKYDDRIDDVNETLTAILRNHRLAITYPSSKGGNRSFLFEPYTLVFYKTGLYVAGRDCDKAAVILLSLDRFISVEWRKDDVFEFPEAWQPSELSDGGFGIILGPVTDVAIRFEAAVARFVERAEWHETQEIETLPNGDIVLKMRVAGTIELTSWVMSWGSKAEVLASSELRASIAAEHAKAAALYTRTPV
jgi:predicted DNA-binding transcriptional regulator YafY